ncbi:sulfide/dihydroorotate dehydrogenase-like FAD/NAD-binding protein [bacterium]|nr:sulfide/dihydroorotate dehydrogenase-like FAD/NAD-binding protein [bacterium]
MNKILKKLELAPGIKLFEVDVPEVAAKALPGHFVIVRNSDRGERIPLTIADTDKSRGVITLIFQEVGKSTLELGLFREGDNLPCVVGPLGKPSEIEKFGTVVCIGGGVGVAPIFPIIKGLKAAGNRVLSIIGARNKELLILENEVRMYSDETYVTTDDGSYGTKGFVCDQLGSLLTNETNIDRVVAIGPSIMMKAVAEMTRPYKIPTIVSLNSIMVDGTGMCGACRVEVGGETKFTCVDGPEFDGHLVDFEMLMKRLSMYSSQEKKALDDYKGKI